VDCLAIMSLIGTSLLSVIRPLLASAPEKEPSNFVYDPFRSEDGRGVMRFAGSSAEDKSRRNSWNALIRPLNKEQKPYNCMLRQGRKEGLNWSDPSAIKYKLSDVQALAQDIENRYSELITLIAAKEESLGVKQSTADAAEKATKKVHFQSISELELLQRAVNDLRSALGTIELDRRAIQWFLKNAKTFKEGEQKFVRVPIKQSMLPSLSIVTYGRPSETDRVWLVKKLPELMRDSHLSTVFLTAPPRAISEYEVLADGRRWIKKINALSDEDAAPLIRWYQKTNKKMDKSMDSQVQEIWAWYELCKSWNSKQPSENHIKFPKGLHEPRDRPSGHERQNKLNSKQTEEIAHLQKQLAEFGKVFAGFTDTLQRSSNTSMASVGQEQTVVPTKTLFFDAPLFGLELRVSGWLRAVPKKGGYKHEELFVFVDAEGNKPRHIGEVTYDPSEMSCASVDSFNAIATLCAMLVHEGKPKIGAAIINPLLASKVNLELIQKRLQFEPDTRYLATLGALPSVFHKHFWAYNSHSGEMIPWVMLLLRGGVSAFNPTARWTLLISSEIDSDAEWPLGDTPQVPLSVAIGEDEDELLRYLDMPSGQRALTDERRSGVENAQALFEGLKSCARNPDLFDGTMAPYFSALVKDIAAAEKVSDLPNWVRIMFDFATVNFEGTLYAETLLEDLLDRARSRAAAQTLLPADATDAQINTMISQQTLTMGDGWETRLLNPSRPESPEHIIDPVDSDEEENHFVEDDGGHDEDAPLDDRTPVRGPSPLPELPRELEPSKLEPEIKVHGVTYYLLNKADLVEDSPIGVVRLSVFRNGAVYVAAAGMLAPTSTAKVESVYPSLKAERKVDVFIHDERSWIRSKDNKPSPKKDPKATGRQPEAGPSKAKPIEEEIKIDSPAVTEEKKKDAKALPPSTSASPSTSTEKPKKGKGKAKAKAQPEAGPSTVEPKGSEAAENSQDVTIPGRSNKTQMCICTCTTYPCKHTKQDVRRLFIEAGLKPIDVATGADTDAIVVKKGKKKEDPLLGDNPSNVLNLPGKYHGDRITDEQKKLLRAALKLSDDPLPSNFMELSNEERKAEKKRRYLPRWATAAVSADPLNLEKIAKGEITEKTRLAVPGKPRNPAKASNRASLGEAPRSTGKSVGDKWKSLKEQFKDVSLWSNPKTGREKQFKAAFDRLKSEVGEAGQSALPKYRRRPSNLGTQNNSSTASLQTTEGAALGGLAQTLGLMKSIAEAFGSINKAMRGD